MKKINLIVLTFISLSVVFAYGAGKKKQSVRKPASAAGIESYDCKDATGSHFKIIFSENSINKDLPLVLDLTAPDVNVISSSLNDKSQIVLSGIQIGDKETLLDISNLKGSSGYRAGKALLVDSEKKNVNYDVSCIKE